VGRPTAATGAARLGDAGLSEPPICGIDAPLRAVSIDVTSSTPTARAAAA